MHRAAANDDLARVSYLPVSLAECSTRAPTLGIRPTRWHEAVVPDASQDLCTSLAPRRGTGGPTRPGPPQRAIRPPPCTDHAVSIRPVHTEDRTWPGARMRDSRDEHQGTRLARHRRLALGTAGGLCLLALAGGAGLLLSDSHSGVPTGAGAGPSPASSPTTAEPIPASPTPSEPAAPTESPSASADSSPSATPPSTTPAPTSGAKTVTARPSAKPSVRNLRTSVPPRPLPTLPVPPTSCPPGHLASWDGCHSMPPPIVMPYPSTSG